MSDINYQPTVSDNSDLTQKIIDKIAEKLGKKPDEIDLNANIIDDLGADSLDTVELVMELEEYFDIEIPDEVAEKLKTVKDIVDYISTHNKAK